MKPRLQLLRKKTSKSNNKVTDLEKMLRSTTNPKINSKTIDDANYTAINLGKYSINKILNEMLSRE
jgi:hypothetical protein